MFYVFYKRVVFCLDKKPTINADRVKSLLKENGLTMKYFNDKFGKNRSFLSNVLSGSDNIDESQIAILAAKLDTTPEYLKGETDIKEKPTARNGDEHSEIMKKIISGSSKLPEEKQLLVLELIKSIKEDQ